MTLDDKLAALDAEQARRRAAAQVQKPVVPVDAASLLLVDRSHRMPRVLMGKRNSRHAFMPDVYVFPGGRRERSDNTTSSANPLAAPVVRKLLAFTGSGFREGSARGLAVAAARETEEETGLSLTPQRYSGAFRPDLSSFRLIARAVTPPGQNRRYDTRFFACFTDEAGVEPGAIRDSDELAGLEWIPVDALERYPVPRITRVVLDDLLSIISESETIPFDCPVPFYRSRRGSFYRDII